ncbi:surface/cell-adhesion protein [Clostridium senegalense]|uniref:surface/cell-adhesion protein n=1 Tax=Clostridium senegalense TaxID=1465809 RepID=UPI000288A7BC|nr:surface/cell-adhesion protein [Clostridium senegalense]
MNKNKNKTGIISILLSLILILNIIMPINVFADEKTEEKNILNEINSLKEVIKSKKTKDYLDCLTLRALGEPINKQDLNLVENGNSKVNAQNIIKLFSAKEDIKNREYIKYVKVLTDNLNENGFLSAKGNELQDYDLGTTALCIIALELTVSDYNKELASKALIKYVNSELEKDNDQIKDVVSISNTIVALKLLNLENCNENINKFLDIFKYCINYEGKIETDMTWPSYNGSLIQALTLIGEDPTSDNWTSDNDTNLIDGLNAFDCNTDEKKIK